MTAADRAAAERQSQGLPPTVADPATVARVAALLRHAAVEEPRHPARDGA